MNLLQALTGWVNYQFLRNFGTEQQRNRITTLEKVYDYMEKNDIPTNKFFK